MDPEDQAKGLLAFVQSIVQIDWLSTLITAAIILAFTAVIARIVTKFLCHSLSNDKNPLPSSSIFVNIGRVVVWCIGLSVMLSSCFNVDISAVVTALGVGGIAISLGFQDTLSNLIGGLQVSLMGLVEPGDHIDVSGQRGIVRDVTWRHTAIENATGEVVVVPNSVINKTSLVKLAPPNATSVPVVIAFPSEADNTKESLAALSSRIEATANAALRELGTVEVPAQLVLSEITDAGCKGKIKITVAPEVSTAKATDAVVRAVAPFAKR